jgi:hypothetical protein
MPDRPTGDSPNVSPPARGPKNLDRAADDCALVPLSPVGPTLRETVAGFTTVAATDPEATEIADITDHRKTGVSVQTVAGFVSSTPTAAYAEPDASATHFPPPDLITEYVPLNGSVTLHQFTPSTVCAATLPVPGTTIIFVALAAMALAPTPVSGHVWYSQAVPF